MKKKKVLLALKPDLRRVRFQNWCSKSENNKLGRLIVKIICLLLAVQPYKLFCIIFL
jgi:hypothetical protein